MFWGIEGKVKCDTNGPIVSVSRRTDSIMTETKNISTNTDAQHNYAEKTKD
jgi:hypothetical protein